MLCSFFFKLGGWMLGAKCKIWKIQVWFIVGVIIVVIVNYFDDLVYFDG
jgi:hypothetical protein